MRAGAFCIGYALCYSLLAITGLYNAFGFYQIARTRWLGSALTIAIVVGALAVAAGISSIRAAIAIVV